MSDSPHITALMRQRKLAEKPRMKFRIVEGKVELYEACLPENDRATVLAAATAAEKRLRDEAAAEVMENIASGDSVESGGIYLGTWTPSDREGASLGKTFNVFAAPENLPGMHDYDTTIQHIAALDNWHGHSGENYAADKELYDALRAGDYAGGWIMPTRDLMGGYDANTIHVTADNICDRKNKGAFAGTFNRTFASATDSEWYWSCTQDRTDATRTWVVRTHDKYQFFYVKEKSKFSCRPVRLELKS